MESGGLVSDAIVSALIGERLDTPEAQHGAIFDGYPRTQHQAEALDLLLAERDRRLDHVIELAVDEDERWSQRITGRFTCAQVRRGLSRPASSSPRSPGTCDVCGATRVQAAPRRQ